MIDSGTMTKPRFLRVGRSATLYRSNPRNLRSYLGDAPSWMKNSPGVTVITQADDVGLCSVASRGAALLFE